MPKSPRGGSRQAELFPRSKRPTVPIDENHRLVQLADRLDWTEMEVRAEEIRASKLKNAAGRPPKLRALLGAMVLRATRYEPYRVLEDLIRHYAPARYLCGLTETEWTPDHNTLHDFMELMGEEGVRFINEYAVEWAVEEKLADPKVLVADTTAQEAQTPYPNEMGLMAAFVASLGAACKDAGEAFRKFAGDAKPSFEAAKKKAREYRLFAKTKEMKDKVTAQMANIIAAVQQKLARAIERAPTEKQSRLKGYGKVARAKVLQLHETMTKLIPQIHYWLDTGWVAAGKVISLHIPERAPRLEIRCHRGEGARRALRETTQGVCIRPRWMEREERRRAEESGREGGGPGPPRESRVGGERRHQEEARQRTRPGRGGNRNHQAPQVRLQSASCPLRQDDGLLWSISRAGLQPQQAGAGVGEAQQRAACRLSEPRAVGSALESAAGISPSPDAGRGPRRRSPLPFWGSPISGQPVAMPSPLPTKGVLSYLSRSSTRSCRRSGVHLGERWRVVWCAARWTWSVTGSAMELLRSTTGARSVRRRQGWLSPDENR